MIKAIHLLLADGKSRGMDGIPAKLDKSTGLIGHDPFFYFCKTSLQTAEGEFF